MRMAVWMVIGCISFAAGVPIGFADEGGEGSYRQVRVERGMFVGEALAMLEQEKRSLAKQIASHVVNELAPKFGKGERQSMRLAERLMSLALNLDPRNRIATVANFQLGRGVVPRKVEVEYSPEVISQLLVTRAKFLQGEGEGANLVLAGFLFEIAVEICPRNEDAIYEHEMFRLDVGPVDWAVLSPKSVGK